MEIKIKLDDKPNLKRLYEKDPTRAKEIISTFVQLMDESCDESKGIAWSELPSQLSPELTFGELIRGVLRGALDVREINPETFDVLKIEAHALSMLSPRRNYIDGGVKYYAWREHFKLKSDEQVNAETIATIIRKLLRYAKYIDVQTLQNHLESNQIATYRGLGDEQIKRLPFYPALRYQRETFGDLRVGVFLDEIGFFDCGHNDGDHCIACSRFDIHRIGKYKACLSCNAGYIDERSE
ncbi:hypothetical protein UFOVP453_20 [uncultured Caudovirales phage]|uniref:Uncharacterized protein n=1 Tax=uncultured Caudovirales phage TaxID=2100421 RepID=A0A6J5MKN9_9CAUD|nr:hypothetical protein UFOVP453_20 [uncultured Caudovirales phage]